MKLVSIIIPAYNCEKWIGQTIESVLNQTWPKKEIVIVDDGSTDNTLSIINRYNSNSIKVVRHDNGGASRARNSGLEVAQGDFIQWLDSDDILAPDKIENHIGALEKEDVDVLTLGKFGSFLYRTEKAIFRNNSLWQDLQPLEWLFIRFSENCWAQAATWLISRHLCEIAGPWDERLCLDEDGEYFCRLVSKSRGVRFVENAISYYRWGNPIALSKIRSAAALESILLSMRLSFAYLLAIEDSERTRKACVEFIQHRFLIYFLNNAEVIRKAANLAKELGGVLTKPDPGWKLRTAESFLGPIKALGLKSASRTLRTHIIRSGDKLLFDIGTRKKTSFYYSAVVLYMNLAHKSLHFLAKYLIGFFGCLYLFTIGLLFRKHRSFLSSICQYFGYKPKGVQRIIPTVQFADVMKRGRPIRLLELTAIEGNITLLELIVINHFIQDRKPLNIFELGTFDGRTTLNMAANSGDDAKVHTIDLPRTMMSTTALKLEDNERAFVDKDISGTRFSGKIETRKIIQLYGDTATYDFRPYYDSMDLVFIDASHEHAYVRNDTEIAIQLLRDGKGTIIWHDYGNWPGVTRALNELFERSRIFKGIRHIEGTTLAFLII